VNEWEWQLLESQPSAPHIEIHGAAIVAGSRVRLCPHPGGDALDMMVYGKVATVASIEQDYEGHWQLSVVLDDDPGRDLGWLRQPGHRFFFSPDEVEPIGRVEPGSVTRTPVLVAGIGNIFLGDDGFGVEVVRRLSLTQLPEGVRAVDFGIRGLDLAYALSDAPGPAILVDACPRGQAPGTLYVIEPEIDAPLVGRAAPAVDPHGMDPAVVIRMAAAMGGDLTRLLLVGCEPATLGPDEGQLGLSEPVNAAAAKAVEVIQTLVRDIQDGRWPATPGAA
jgi:hydrogenase maturation protease